MPTFLARRYGRSGEQVSTAEKVIGAGILLVLAALGVTVVRALTVRTEGGSEPALAMAAAEPGEKPAHAGKPDPFDLPKLDQAGWTGPSGVQWFSRETVHEKINGRDGLYKAYEMTGLTFGTYRYAGDDDRYVDVYAYDMGETLNAFGCYKAEFAEGMPAIKTGRGGYRAEQSLFFWKGTYYVQLIAGDTVVEADAAILSGLAEQIAAKIDDDGGSLWADAVLPKANRRPDSLGYELNNAFSLNFLRGVFKADYTDGDAQVTMFLHRAPSPAAARKLLDQYADYLAKYGKVVSREDSAGGQTLVGEAVEMYDVVFCKGPYLGGVNGADDVKLARKHGLAFRDGLKAGS